MIHNTELTRASGKQSAICSATSVDNTFNVIGSKVVGEVNGVIYSKCKAAGVVIAEPK